MERGDAGRGHDRRRARAYRLRRDGDSVHGMSRLMSRFLPAVLLLTIAACSQAPPLATVPPAAPRFAPPPPGLARLLGRDAATVMALLGKPSLDRREGTARLLQFVRPPCVLDVFLYPDAGAAPTVRTAAARRPDGSRIDAGACLTLLSPTP
jgi:hypothetical protein